MNCVVLVELTSIFFLFSFIQRIVCHLQVFALSRWLAVRLPVEYYEFARGLQWSIPYFSLPWESGHIPYNVKTNSSLPDNTHSYMSKIHYSGIFLGDQLKPKNLNGPGYHWLQWNMNHSLTYETSTFSVTRF